MSHLRRNVNLLLGSKPASFKMFTLYLFASLFMLRVLLAPRVGVLEQLHPRSYTFGVDA